MKSRDIEKIVEQISKMEKEISSLKNSIGQLASIKILMGDLEAKIITELVGSYIDYDDIYKLILTDEIFISFKNITYPSESFLHEGIARLEKDGYKCELANGNLDIKNNLKGE